MVTRLHGTVTSLEGNTVLIALEDEQIIKVSLQMLTPAPQVGDAYDLHLLPAAEAALVTEELARTMLNQLVADVPNR